MEGGGCAGWCEGVSFLGYYLMTGLHVVHRSYGGENSKIRSFLAALGAPARRGWSACDVVWFSEDDYLNPPTAFSQLARAADPTPDGDYFGLYARSMAATAWDYPASLAYQGSQPFLWRQLAVEPRPVEPSLRRRLTTIAAVPGRTAVNRPRSRDSGLEVG